MLNPVQRIFLAGGLTGLAIGAVTVALCYEEQRINDKIHDLETENCKLKMDNRLLADKIRKLEEDDDDSDEEEES